MGLPTVTMATLAARPTSHSNCANGGLCYSPVKLVGRFSRNAVMPSAKSLLLDTSP